MAGLPPPIGLRSQHFIWVPEHNFCSPNDGTGKGFGRQRNCVPMGHQASCWVRHKGPIQSRVAARTNGEERERSAGAQMGTSIRDLESQINRSVSEPLRVEFCTGEPDPGAPIIGWPLAAEQNYNSKMVVEDMGVSVDLTRGVQGSIVKQEVKKVIETVMDKKGRGGEMKKAAQIGELTRVAVKEEEVTRALPSKQRTISYFFFYPRDELSSSVP